MKKSKIVLFLIIILYSVGLSGRTHITLPKVQYALALDLYYSGKYYDAIQEFRNLIKEHPEAKNYCGNSYYWIGMSYFKLKKYKTAGINFNKVLKGFPNSKYYVDAYYYLGRTYQLRKYYKTAIKIFTKIYKKYPSHELADNALLWRGVCFYSQHKNKTALKDFYKILRVYPKGNKADAARYMINLIKGGKKQIVIKEKVIKVSDDSKLKAWQELLKTKEAALKEKEKELQAKEKILEEKEKLINQAQNQNSNAGKTQNNANTKANAVQ